MKKIIIFVGIILMIFIVSFAMFFNNSSDEMSKAISGKVSSDIRSKDAELEYVKSRAKTLKQNELGYWEADFGDGIVLIYVESGKFIMGNDELSADVATETYTASPQHEVMLDHYWISKTPTTNGQFRKFVKETSYISDVEKENSPGPYVYDFSISAFQPKKGYYWDNAFKDVIKKYPEITITDQHPVSCVSWNDAIAYSKWLKAKTGLNFTLPTEAEWEYAARGDDGRIYPWGNEEPDGEKANYADETFDKYFPNTEQSVVHRGINDGYAITSPVGMFPKGSSPIGALDMAGNLTEWIYDSQYEYTSESIENPIGVSDNNIKMQKAGFWAGSAGRIDVKKEVSIGHNIRSDGRQGDTLDSADDHLGFRIGISYVEREVSE